MSKSVENGVSSSFQNMKFYTNQLAPDVKTPGIVEGSYDVKAKGAHSVMLWTPIVHFLLKYSFYHLVSLYSYHIDFLQSLLPLQENMFHILYI